MIFSTVQSNCSHGYTKYSAVKTYKCPIIYKLLTRYKEYFYNISIHYSSHFPINLVLMN